MNIYIKNMVSARCKMAVKSVLEELKIDYLSIELGEVKLPAALSPEQQEKLEAGLRHYELELIEDRNKVLVDTTKRLIIETVRSPALELNFRISEYLSKTLDYDYTYLANIFSELEGRTIERFYISSRIERVKELIANDLSISEISYQLNYSSVAHLSHQFKKVTGETLSVFKKRCRSPGRVT